MTWHLITSEWAWDGQACRAAWHWLLFSRGFGHLLDALNLAGLYCLFRRREKIVRWVNRMSKKPLGRPDADGWRVRINYDRKDSR